MFSGDLIIAFAAFVAGLWAGTRWPDLFSRVWGWLVAAWNFVIALPGRVVGIFKKS